MRKGIIASAASALALCASAVTVSSVTMTPDASSGTMRVEYTLSGSATFVPTLSIETNGPAGWAAVDDKIVSKAFGDVNRKVTGSGGVIRFAPEGGFIDDIAGARAVVTIWPMDDTPDYMVYSLAAGAASTDERVRYYASTNAMPGGLLGNLQYRATYMVFRKVRAKGVTWRMGANRSAEDISTLFTYTDSGVTKYTEEQHEVTLDHNYYIGVFPLTRAQYCILMGSWNKGWFPLDVDMADLRIQDGLWYNIYQCAYGDALWPAPPTSSSVLGKLRATCSSEIDFMLPTEAEWEFACRAGHGDNCFGDGSEFTMSYLPADNRLVDSSLDRLGRYKANNATAWFSSWQNARDFGPEQGITNGVPVAGSYAPNDWGIYDMLGGVWEWCLDWYQNDITSLNGALNIDPTDGSKCADGVTAGANRVMRGGAWHADSYQCRPARRSSNGPGWRGDYASSGMRVTCRMGLR